MEKITILILPQTVICPLCLQKIQYEKYEGHLRVHEVAEFFADLLALSRR